VKPCLSTTSHRLCRYSSFVCHPARGPLLSLLFCPSFPSPKNCHPERSGSRHFVSHAVEGPAVALPLLPGRAGLQPGVKKPSRSDLHSAEGPSEGEAQRLIIAFAFAVACSCRSPSASARRNPQKPVKPPTHLTPCQSTRSTWHSSSPPTAILDTEEKEKPRANRGFSILKPLNSFRKNILPVTHLE